MRSLIERTRCGAFLQPRVFALAAFLLGLFALPALAVTTSTVTGTVTDENGSVITSASVAILTGPTNGRQSTTNGLGKYTLSGLTAGNYTLIARRAGFASQSRGITLVSGATATLDFRLITNATAGGTLQGTVTRRSNGAAISGAQVTLTPPVGNTETLTTGADGSYRFTGLITNSYRLSVSAVGFGTVTRSGITVRAGQTTTSNFQLSASQNATGTLQGSVHNQNGAGISGVEVRLLSGASAGLVATTAGNGSYTLTGILPDLYDVRFRGTGFSDLVQTGVSVNANQTTRLNVTLSGSAAGTGTVSGSVQDTAGNPISGATVSVQSGPTSNVQATTDASGLYSLANLAAGSYTLAAQRAGFATGQRTVTVAAGTSTQLNFTLVTSTAGTGALQGTITRQDQNIPVSGATVTLTPPSGSALTVTTGADGTYLFSALTPGTYRLNVTATGFTAVTRTGISVRSGQTTTSNVSLVTQQGAVGILQGRVTDQRGVGLMSITVKLVSGSSTGLMTTTNASGFYTLSGIVPDAYAVQFSGTGFIQSTLQNVSVAAGVTTTLNASLLPVGAGSTLSGTVFDPLGHPLQGARVVVSTGPVTGGFSVTGSDGTYRIRALSPGAYTITAAATGFLLSSAAVSIASGQPSTQDFTLAADASSTFGAITGHLSGPTAATDVSGATAKITSGPLAGTAAVVDPDGNYVFLNLPAGIYDLTFSLAGQADVTRTSIAVISGVTSVVNVTFGAATGNATLSGTVTDSGGKPLTGSTITVLQGTTTVGSATTDANGHFTINSLAAGTYSVTFAKTGFLTTTLSNVTLTDGGTKSLSVALTAQSGSTTGTINGNVRDVNGLGVPNASVHLVGGSIDEYAQTNSAGHFEFDNLPVGSYNVTVTTNGTIPATQNNVQIQGGDTVTLTFTLQNQVGASTIAGVVRNPAGLPIQGATVTIVSAPFNGLKVTTGADGRFLFIGLPTGLYTLQAKADGYQPALRVFYVRPGGTANGDFRLQR